MKKAFTISLAFLLLLLSVRDLVTFAAFKAQQEIIADQLCVNKYEPIPMCAGQCFLEEQIEENHEQSSDPFAAAQVELTEKVVYFPSSFTAKLATRIDIAAETGFCYRLLAGITPADTLFHPPRMSA